jgi:cytochrome c-type biogenesis protein
MDEIKTDKKVMRRRGMYHTLFFLLGFSTIFIALGFSTSFFYEWFLRYDELIRQTGAIFIVLFGLMIIGVFTPQFLMRDRKFTFKNRPAGFLGTFVIGLAFAAGWTPCTGPITAAIYALAATNPGSGVWYMLAYVLGFAIPFFVLSFFVAQMGWLRKHNKKIMNIGGYVMIGVGILLFFDGLTFLIRVLSPFFGDFQGF